MSKKDLKEIGESIRRISGVQPVVMSGKVTEVQEADGTCAVLLSIDDEPTEGVLITAVTGNANGVVLLPKQDSQVWVAEIDGPGKWGVVKYSEVEKVTVTIGGTAEVVVTEGEIVLNGGEKGGVVVVADLVEKINRLENTLNGLITKFNAHTHVYAPGPLPPVPTAPPIPLETAVIAPVTMVADLENPKVKH